MKTRAELIVDAVKKLQTAWSEIESADLSDIVPAKFEIRQHKIAVELNAFTLALQRQIHPAKKRANKIISLRAQLQSLEDEVGVTTIDSLEQEIIALVHKRLSLRSNVKADRNKADAIEKTIRQKERQICELQTSQNEEE